MSSSQSQRQKLKIHNIEIVWSFIGENIFILWIDFQIFVQWMKNPLRGHKNMHLGAYQGVVEQVNMIIEKYLW